VLPSPVNGLFSGANRIVFATLYFTRAFFFGAGILI
jgi:hypothetical protein